MRKLLLAVILAMAPVPAGAWGYFGHHMISEVAMKSLPADLPAFLRSDLAIAQIGALSQEPDMSRGAGQPHDADLDPGHFLDVSDDFTILGGPKLSALPATRQDYDTALRAIGSNEYKAGFLPYNILEGWQQLVHDFALLRAWQASVKHAPAFKVSAADRRQYGRLLDVRRMLVLRDLGVWAHFVEDASQPMHVSVHYNGWGDGPNPESFVTGPGLHSRFESVFVGAQVKEADIAAAMRPLAHCDDSLQGCTQAYLAGTAQWTVKLYHLDKAGAFDVATPESRHFAVQRLADAANHLRDMVVDAWRASKDETLGYKVKTPVVDYEAGKAIMPLQSMD